MKAEVRLKTAESAIGEVNQLVDEYASARAQVESLKIQGTWLIAAKNTLEPTQMEALARVQETVVKINDNKPKN